MAELENEFGILCKAEGRYAEAGQHYRRAAAIIRRVGPTAGLELADLYHNLAGLAHSRGHYLRGEKLARRGIALRLRRHPPNSLQVWRDRTAHAALLDGLGLQRSSLPVYRKALGIFRRRLGAFDYEVALTLNNLGCALAELGRPSEARRALMEALRIKRATLGGKHVEVAIALHNLASVEREP